MTIQILTVLVLVASLFSALPAWAAKPDMPHGDFFELRPINTGKVQQVIDPFTIQLEDKRIIRLSGIDFPGYNPNLPGPLASMTLKILKDMLEGKTVNVYQTMDEKWGRSNRMGQQLAHLEVQQGSAWVQGTLLALGLARVMTDERTPEMASQMYMFEQLARAEKNGLWALDDYKVLTPEEAESHSGEIMIVEGKVVSTAMRQNNIYVNFGTDWKSDFTITILPQNRLKFFDRNIDPLKWNNKVIRVRGYIGDYNGPYIEADHPESIEISPPDVNRAPASDLPLKTKSQGPMLRSTSKN